MVDWHRSNDKIFWENTIKNMISFDGPDNIWDATTQRKQADHPNMREHNHRLRTDWEKISEYKQMRNKYPPKRSDWIFRISFDVFVEILKE